MMVLLTTYGVSHCAEQLPENLKAAILGRWSMSICPKANIGMRWSLSDTLANGARFSSVKFLLVAAMLSLRVILISFTTRMRKCAVGNGFFCLIHHTLPACIHIQQHIQW